MIRTVGKQYCQYKQVQFVYVRATVMQSNKFIINGTLFLQIVEKQVQYQHPARTKRANKQIQQTLNANRNLLLLVSFSVLQGYKFFSYQERKRHLFVSGHLTECTIKKSPSFFIYLFIFYLLLFSTSLFCFYLSF